MRLIEPVTLPAAAGMPPQVAQVPMATLAAAPGQSRFSQSVIRLGCSVSDSGSKPPAPMAE
jgi:hypothetical protein